MYGLHQMLGFDNCPEEAGAIRDFIPNYKINLVTPQSMEDMSVFRTCLQQIFSMVKYNSEKTGGHNEKSWREGGDGCVQSN